MSKFLSGRQSNLKLGVAGYTESKTVLETTGKVGIGTTDAQGFSLYVVGPTNITGITTFTSGLNLPDNKLATFGDDEDLKIYHDSNGQSYIKDVGTGDLNLTSDGTGIHLQNNGGSTLARFYTAGPSEIHHAGSRKIHTTSNGVEVTGLTDTDTLNVSGDSTFVGGVDVDGHTELDNLNVSGIATVAGNTDLNGNLDVDGTTELDGLNVDGSTTLDNTTVAGTLTVNGDIDLNGDIDVDGHTELDQLRVSGVSTFAGNVDISSNGNLTVAGNLIVQGTETRLNTTALEVEDINIGIASATPKLSNASLDGAGITIYGSAGDKTLTWNNANSRMEFNTDLYSPNFFVGGITATGNVDFDGNLDVDGHTELDQLRVSGVSTFQSNVHLGDNDIINLGDNDDFQIYHHSNGTGIIQNAGSGQLQLRSNTIRLLNQATDEDYAFFRDDGAVELYYDNSKKFETTGIGVSIYNDLNVGTGVTVYGNAGIVSAISFYGDGSNLTNTGATLSATSGVERLVTTQLTSGTMVDAATDGDLTFNATNNTLNTVNIAISGGISTNGANYGQSQQLLRSTGSGWEWATVPGIFSVNNILNGFNVLEEGGQVGTAGSIHTLDFRGGNITAFANAQPNGIATITVSDTPTFTSLTVTGNSTLPNVIGITTFSNNVHVGSGITMYAATGIVSATKLYGDGSDLTGINAGAILGASSGTQRLVMTSLTSGAMLNAATDADLTFNATDNLLSVPNFEINGGTVSAGGTTGTDGQYLESTGVGVTWKSFPTLRTTHTETANAGVTTFSYTYNVNFLDVFVNGVKLTPSEYTASNGTSITLQTATFQDDIVEFVSYNTVSAYGGGGSQQANVSDGDRGDIIVSGSGTVWSIDADTIGPTELIDTGVSAGTYNFATITVGTDGRIQSASTGTPPAETFTAVGIQSGGSLVGSAQTINFGNNLTATISNGVATVNSTASGGGGGASVQVSDTAPSNPSEGDLWWRSTDGKGFIYYNDGNSNQWVEFNPSAVGIAGISTTGTSTFNVISANTYQGITTSMISDYGNGLSGGGGGGGGISNVVEDTTPQLGGNLDLNSNNITGTGNINISGTVTATNFSGITTSMISDYGNGLSGGGGSTFASRSANSYVATAGQTTFASTYTVGYVDVYLNGSKLTGDQYTATNGSTIVLLEGASLGDIVEVIGLQTTASSPVTRNAETLTIGSIASGITTTGTITLPKTGVMISIHPVGNASGWLRLYTRSDLADADAGRARTQDPNPGSGVILETITSGISTVYLSPQTIFASAEDTPINTFNYRFTKDGTAGITTFTFKYLSLEP